MDKIAKKPIKITDTTLRDGHQSSLATRMRTEDMVPDCRGIGSGGVSFGRGMGGSDL